MEKQQAQFIADYINHERDNAFDSLPHSPFDVLDAWEVDSSMILDALDTWNNQQDKGE